MTKELLMTPKDISDRKRLEAKKNGTWKPRQLSQSRDNLRKREVYHQKKRRALTISENAPTPKPVTVTVKFPDLDKLTRKELKKLVLESRRGINASIHIPLKVREEGDPNVTKILRTDLAKFIAQKKDLEAANARIEVGKESLLALEATISTKDSTIVQLRSEIQTARRQRDEANAHSKLLGDNLEAANVRIKSSNDRMEEIDRKIDDLNIGMGELNRRAIRWKSAFLATLFIVALPAMATASAAVYLLTHR